MKEAVVLVAASTEERVEGVHGLLARDVLGIGPINVRGAVGGLHARIPEFSQFTISNEKEDFICSVECYH